MHQSSTSVSTVYCTHVPFVTLCSICTWIKSPSSFAPVYRNHFCILGLPFCGRDEIPTKGFLTVVHFGYTQAIHQTALLNKGELCVWNCIGTVLLLGLCGSCFPLASSCTICMYQRGAVAWFSMIFCLVQSIRGRFHQLRAEWLIRLCHSSFPKLLFAKAAQRKSERWIHSTSSEQDTKIPPNQRKKVWNFWGRFVAWFQFVACWLCQVLELEAVFSAQLAKYSQWRLQQINLNYRIWF